MLEASENEIRTACRKNKRMDQLKWCTVVKKLQEWNGRIEVDISSSYRFNGNTISF
jgi:hypothetical protein